MDDQNIRKILREVIESFINEELSVSNDVYLYVDRIIDEFKEKYRNKKYFYSEMSIRMDDVWVIPVNLISVNCKAEITNGVDIPCQINIYEFKSEDDLDSAYDANKFSLPTNDFNESLFRINISTIGIENVGFNLLHLKGTLFHEAEHAFQRIMASKPLKGAKGSYRKAVNILDNDATQIERDDMLKSVATLVYYFNKIEIDANINGLYGELTLLGPDKVKETNFYREYTDICKMADQVIDNFDDNTANTVAYFGYTPKSFVNFILQSQRYIQKRMMKVIQRAHNKTPKLEVRKPKPLGFYVK